MALATAVTSMLLGESALNAQTTGAISEQITKDLPQIKNIRDRALLQGFIFDNVENLSEDSIEILDVILGKQKNDRLKLIPTDDFGSVSHGALQHDQGMSVE